MMKIRSLMFTLLACIVLAGGMPFAPYASAEDTVEPNVPAPSKWQTTSTNKEWLKGAAYGSAQFYAVGDNGTVIRSLDGEGILWTPGAQAVSFPNLGDDASVFT